MSQDPTPTAMAVDDRRAAQRQTYEAVVVSQTHWDREWYATFEQFRHRLVYVMDRLLNLLESKPGFRTFTFDGQACVLEDYLRIRPENEERIRCLSQEGRILFGPWFSLPDEYLVSGESLIRNLLMGRRIASDYGTLNTAGYCPDAFGHVNQLPQILAGFGLSSALFTRGFGDERDRLGLTFRWLSSDPEIGVVGVNLIGGYGNASALGYPERHCDIAITPLDLSSAEEYVQQILDRMRPMTKTRTLLFSNGVDHMEAQFDLPEVIEHINASELPVTLRHGTHQEFIDAVLAEKPHLEEWRGEFRSGRDQVILTGTLSARIYLKQMNARCQSLLEGLAEPLAAVARIHDGGEDFQPFLQEAWRLVLLNHPHDDICGCSIDEVHREMVPRFARAEQIAEIAIADSLRRLGQKAKPCRRDALAHAAVFNPSPWERRGAGEFTLTLPADVAEDDTDLRLLTADGEILPASFTFLRREFSNTFSHFDPIHQRCQVNRWRVRFAAREMAPVSVETLAVERGKSGGKSGITATDWSLENELISVTVNPNGTINIECRETGETLSGLMLFEDVADVGDEYDFCPAEDPGARTTVDCQAESRVLEHGPLSAALAITLPWALPEGINADRTARLETEVDSTLEVHLTLRSRSAVIEVDVAWENRARDHRLRVALPTKIVTDHSSAETHFDVIDRPLEMIQPQCEWEQPPLNFHPMDRFVSISDGEQGIALLGEGLHEYEATVLDDGTRLELTLLRAVGWLALPGLKTRMVGAAGPVIETPEAQCLGPRRVRFAIAPHRGDWKAGEIHRRAMEFNIPLAANQTLSPSGTLDSARGYVSVDNPDLVITAVKRAERGDSLIVRVLNLGTAGAAGTIQVGFDVAKAWITDLAEDRRAELKVADDHAVQITARPRQLVTVEFEPLSGAR